MKIAYFLDIPKGLGGAGNVLLEQAKLMSAVYEVLVIIPCSANGEVNPEYERRCKKAHIRYRGMAYSTAYTIQNIDVLSAWKAMEDIRRMATDEKVDFFHSVQFNIGAELVSRELKIPHLMNSYSIRKEEFILAFMDIFPSYHSCDSRLYCELWAKGLNMKTRCIRPSAPLSCRKRKKERRKNALKILMLGGLCELKNQMLAIQAVELCKRNQMNVSLSIAGDDNLEYAKVCRRYLKENNLEDSVCILGFQSDIVPLLEEHDCYLCTSIKESFPSSIVESMTYDLTILSTPVAGVPELLKDEVNAYISSGYEAKDIADCIRRCFYAYQDGSIKAIHKQAEALWNENFSVPAVTKQLDEYYHHILSDFTKCPKRRFENKISGSVVKQVYMRLTHVGIEDEYILSKCCYYACLGEILKCGKAYIWGAGKYGKYAKQLLETVLQGIEIIAYIDRIKTGNYLGIPIVYPEQAELQKADYIFIAFDQGKEQAIADLEEKGFGYNRDIWLLP